MNPWWEVLEVERGSDRATIRRAYARKLKVTNPEDDPQGFMALREAYEAALSWVDYDQDRDAEEDAPQFGRGVDATASEPEPVARAPLPEPAPIPTDPAMEQRAADHAALRAATAALDAGLRGPWFSDAATLNLQLNRVCEAPAMIEIETRDRVEYWLADLLADTVPRSDPILMRAIDTFGWESEGERPPAIWRVLGRIDEWRMIQLMQDGAHDLAAGWRTLSRGDEPAWQRRIGAMRPAVAAQVRRLFDIADYQAPGIAHSFDAKAASWWRAHLEKPRFGFSDLLLPGLGLLVAGWFAMVSTGAARWASFVAVFAAFLIPVLRVRIIAPWRMRREAEVEPGWIDHGWLGLWLVAATLLITIPSGMVSAVTVAALCVVAVLWMAVVAGREPAFGNPLSRVLAFGALALVGGAAFVALSGPEQIALGVFGVSAAVIVTTGRGAIIELLWRTGHPAIVALTVTFLLAVAAGVRLFLPGAPQPLVPGGAAAIGGMVMMAAARDVQDGSWARTLVPWLRAGLWMALVVAAVFSTPPVERGAPPLVVANPLEQLERREPGFVALKLTNPGLYSAVEMISQQIDDGKRNRDEGAREIDRLVNAAYRERLPRASSTLIANEFDIRLMEMREYESVDPRACAGEAEGSSPKLTDGLQRRHYRHALAVAGSATAGATDMAQGRAISMDEMIRVAANGNAAQAERYAKALEGSDLKAKCAARIAVLEALTAQDDGSIAKTMRPALEAQAAKSSGEEKKRQAP